MASSFSAADSCPQVRVTDLRKSYGAVVALDNTTLTVNRGEFFTLLGPSGSGKTTLLTLIAGLTAPDGGQVIIGEEDVTFASPEDRNIGVVFQNYALFPHLTVWQNIAFPLEMRKVDRKEITKRVGQALDLVKLPQVGDRLPSELSGGQQQRIALARCLVYRPSIVLMDEPLGALDKKLRIYMQAEIRRIHSELGVTVIYVTHDQEEALTMSDRICLMRNARIEQIGPPAQLYFRPESLFAADFLGESNLLAATVVECRDGVITARLASGEQIRGRSAGGRAFRPDEAIRIMARPETLRVLAGGEQSDNTITATIGDAVLMGATTRLSAVSADGTVLNVAMLTSPDGLSYNRGDNVRLGWPLSATVALVDDGSVP